MNDSYFAGFIDGEGSINIVKAKNSRGSYRLSLQVSQCVRTPLDALVERFGGTVAQMIRRKADHRDRFIWQIADGRAEQCLRDLRDLLVVKQDEADIALEFRTTYADKNQNRHCPLTDDVIAKREDLSVRLKACHHG